MFPWCKQDIQDVYKVYTWCTQYVCKGLAHPEDPWALAHHMVYKRYTCCMQGIQGAYKVYKVYTWYTRCVQGIYMVNASYTSFMQSIQGAYMVYNVYTRNTKYTR